MKTKFSARQDTIQPQRSLATIRPAKGRGESRDLSRALLATPVRNDLWRNDKRWQHIYPYRSVYEGHRPNIHYPLCSPESSLGTRFIQTLGEMGNLSGLFLSWIIEVPTRIGTNEALDQATNCFIAGSIAYKTANSMSVVAARKQYSRALTSLQQAITNDVDEVRLSGETMAAVLLLVCYEVRTNPGRTNQNLGSISN
ncbi:hypothetical protein BS50DRAFT_144923 [Corynespora cassiicola Philippines]|uniref:Uncharacterized protein n=1 Tax=Corynespora cassiicola Philippines TaxID=1448308 RepID=A0A2T2N8I9_CORCC|nr:hypothetical protein BS50DRAFT_144923 [Corynespora cassiicola Philippines]